MYISTSSDIHTYEGLLHNTFFSNIGTVRYLHNTSTSYFCPPFEKIFFPSLGISAYQKFLCQLVFLMHGNSVLCYNESNIVYLTWMYCNLKNKTMLFIICLKWKLVKLLGIAATQYKHTKKRDAECFKVHLHPEKYPSSGGIQSSSFVICPMITQS